MWGANGLGGTSLAKARVVIAEHDELGALDGWLRQAHPELADRIAEAGGSDWPLRLASIEQVWAWAAAERFVRGRHEEARDTQREADLEAAKHRLRTTTAELATEQAWHRCLATMNDGASRALKSYEFFAKRQGGGRGPTSVHYRAAARSAIAVAKTEVPAWVMPIEKVAELFPARQHTFDVVIVDEASQAAPTALFLLWLAPRIIAVGDDKQCTPTGNQHDHAKMLDRLRTEFPELPAHVLNFLAPNGNLYNILGSAFPATVRLQEHFRCMPEIISFSSKEYYQGTLVPLRPHGFDRLDPIRVDYVPDAFTTGQGDDLINRAEAERVADLVTACAGDPAYTTRTFGVIALQGSKQRKLIERLIAERLSEEEVDRREIVVGDASDFQGDERHVMFVCTVVAGKTKQYPNSLPFAQRLNVAVSRAMDQMWLVTSLSDGDLTPEDQRYRMISHYMGFENPGAEAPEVASLSSTTLCDPFESLFVQQVYRLIRLRGFHADPMTRFGERTVHVVVRGSGTSVAVMCDEHLGLPAERRHADDEALRDMRRAGWPFCRISHSQFLLDEELALEPLWKVLAESGVHGEENAQWSRSTSER
ncbi:AAA domain-containing protein [Amycolatopsis sp. cmx-4-83]|uniref:AAA domain-containing protein n=1 Tax=Amycolatopsis sp. cmx-4-83 TaxID=2790940 RepID=UPI00397AB18B